MFLPYMFWFAYFCCDDSQMYIIRSRYTWFQSPHPFYEPSWKIGITECGYGWCEGTISCRSFTPAWEVLNVSLREGMSGNLHWAGYCLGSEWPGHWVSVKGLVLSLAFHQEGRTCHSPWPLRMRIGKASAQILKAGSSAQVSWHPGSRVLSVDDCGALQRSLSSRERAQLTWIRRAEAVKSPTDCSLHF